MARDKLENPRLRSLLQLLVKVEFRVFPVKKGFHDDLVMG
jgi:hypothetical protein